MDERKKMQISEVPFYKESDLVAMVSVLPCAAFVEREGELVAWNESAAALRGVPAVEVGVTIPAAQVFLGAFPFFNSGRELSVRIRSAEHFDCALLRQDGRMIAVRGALRVFQTDAGPARLITLSEQPFGDKASAGEGTFLGELLDAAPEAMAITHEARLLYVNTEFTKLFGYAPEDCLGKSLEELLTPASRRGEMERLYAGMSVGERAAMETVRLDSDGDEIDVSLLVGPVRLSGEVFGLFHTFRDIRTQKQAEAILKHRAMHDALTGLANRALFAERVQIALRALRREGSRQFSVLFLDLDGFKGVNDTLGHDAGDRVLLEVSHCLRDCLRPQDTLARFGGDEFAVLVEESPSLAQAEMVAERLHAAICGLKIGAGLAVSASLGVTLVTDETATVARVLREADIAMYYAKAHAKAGTAVYVPGMTMGKHFVEDEEESAA